MALVEKILLVCAALFPAIFLCVYVFKKDRVEKEPIGLLLLLLLMGAVSCLPAAILESLILPVIDSIFAPFGTVTSNGVVLYGGMYKAYTACKTFIGIGLVEEGVKLLFLLLITRKNKNFNSLFDGLIYAVFVSLGFAALENVMYVLENGWLNAATRAILAVPGHMFYAVLMGYYYSLWHMYEKARTKELLLEKNGLIRKAGEGFNGKKYLVMSLVVPTLIHGMYDYCCFVNSSLATLGLLALVGYLYFYCFRRIKNMSKNDVRDGTLVDILLLRKYPQLADNASVVYPSGTSVNG